MPPTPTSDELRGLIATAAERQGLPVDLDGIWRALAGAARAFTRRRAVAAQRPASVQRRTHLRVATAARALEDALAALGRDGRAAVDPWGSRADFEAWLDRLARVRGHAERLGEAPGRPGAPRATATRRLVLDVAWVLSRAGFKVTTYPEGLLAGCVRLVGLAAGYQFSLDESNLRRWLRPAVRLVRAQTDPGWKGRCERAQVIRDLRKTYWIYALIDPRDAGVRYIGLTCNPKYRLYCHREHRAGTTAEKQRWLTDLDGAGLSPRLDVIAELHGTVGNARASERWWTERFAEAGAALVNGEAIRTGGEISPRSAPDITLNSAPSSLLCSEPRGVH